MFFNKNKDDIDKIYKRTSHLEGKTAYLELALERQSGIIHGLDVQIDHIKKEIRNREMSGEKPHKPESQACKYLREKEENIFYPCYKHEHEREKEMKELDDLKEKNRRLEEAFQNVLDEIRKLKIEKDELTSQLTDSHYREIASKRTSEIKIKELENEVAQWKTLFFNLKKLDKDTENKA